MGAQASLHEKEGQVLVEYILMLAFAVGLLAALQSSLKGTVFNVWKVFAKEITAGCPGPGNCIPDQSIK